MKLIAQLSLALALALTLSTAAPSASFVSTAQAQDENAPSAEDLEAAKAAYAEGAAAYGKNDFKAAIVSFKESYRLSKNPVLLYNIGSALESAGDKKLALFYYKKFLKDTPKDAPNRDTAKSSAETLSRELAGEEEPVEPPKDARPVDKPAGPTEPGTFEHNVIEEVPPGKPVDITAFAPKDIGWKVYLFYRTPGSDGFTKVEMKPRYAELVGRIPAASVRGSTIQYYVEARDIGDEMVARSGKSTSPHVIILEEKANARFYPDFDGGNGGNGSNDGEDPLLGSSPGNPERDGGPSDRMTYLKWGTTGAAIGFVALSATFLAIAADASSSLEGAAVASSEQDTCPSGRPCQPYSDSESGLEARGKRFESLGNVFLGLGVVAGVGAGVIWYLDSKAKKKKDSRVTTVPAIGPDFVGAAATVRF